jgi:hypothetical protein
MDDDFEIDDLIAKSEYVEAIKRAADIVKVVSQYATLTKT